MSEVDKQLQELNSFNVEPELKTAAETLLKHYHSCGHDKDVRMFFKCLSKQITESDRGVHKTSEGFSHVVKVHVVSAGKSFGAQQALMNKVKTHPELQVKETGLQESQVGIVFCPINSRVDSDAELAMTKMPADKPVILVLMYHTRKVDYITSERQWTETFANVRMDVHVLFHESVPGLLLCPKNEDAVSKMQDLLWQLRGECVQSKDTDGWYGNTLGKLFPTKMLKNSNNDKCNQSN